MKKKQLVIAMAFVAITCFAISSCNNQSNQDSSTGNEYVSVNEAQQSYNSRVGAYTSETEYVSGNEAYDKGKVGTYTFEGFDGVIYKVVLKPREGKNQAGQAVLVVDGCEKDYGSWKDFSSLGNGLEVRFLDTYMPIPGQDPYHTIFYLKEDGFAYAYNYQQTGNPNKRVKYTKTK